MYITFVNNNSEMAGVMKKIIGQVNVFEKYFENCYYTALDNEGLNIYEGNTIKERIYYDNFFIQKINTRKSFYKGLIAFIIKNSIKLIYIRHKLKDPFFMNFIRKLKQNGVIVFIEVPTYPYKKEVKSKVPLFVDMMYSKYLYKYVENIITFSKHKKIFGIDTININNGVELNSIKVINKEKELNYLNVIGVANISFWHGYDRLIKGLKSYYNGNSKTKSVIVNFNIIGNGPELPYLKELVMNYSLGNYVHFKGYKSGVELNNEFCKADLGVVSLGIHRLGLDSVSTLKSKEYWARGLPFIKSYADHQADELISEYIMNVPPDETEININNLVNFHERLKNIGDIQNKMRNSAERFITWDYQMKPVINEIKRTLIKIENTQRI